MRKIYIIYFGLFLISLVFLSVTFRSYIPQSIKNFVPLIVKDVLKIPSLKKENYELKEEISELQKEFDRFKRETIIGNEKFLGLELSSINAKSEKGNELKIKRYQLISYPHNFGWWGDFYEGRYIEKFKNQLIN